MQHTFSRHAAWDSHTHWVGRKLSSEDGTYNTVTAGFWPSLSGKSPYTILSCSIFARCRANMAQTTQSRSDSGLPFQINDSQPLKVFHLGSKAAHRTPRASCEKPRASRRSCKNGRTLRYGIGRDPLCPYRIEGLMNNLGWMFERESSRRSSSL